MQRVQGGHEGCSQTDREVIAEERSLDAAPPRSGVLDRRQPEHEVDAGKLDVSIVTRIALEHRGRVLVLVLVALAVAVGAGIDVAIKLSIF